MGKLITMNEFEHKGQLENSVKHNCTVVVFCASGDAWKDDRGFSITFLGQTLEKAAQEHVSFYKNLLFAQHRKFCTGAKPRKHLVTVRFEIEDSLETHYVSLGRDTWR